MMIKMSKKAQFPSESPIEYQIRTARSITVE